MKGFLTFICLLLVGCCVGLGFIVSNTEMHAARWQQRIDSAVFMEETNEEIMKAHMYSERCLEAVKMLANENGLLCEREAKLTVVVAQIEEENRALKASLSEAVGRLEKQNKQINELIEQNQRYVWQIEQLERAIELIENSQPEDKVSSVIRNVSTVAEATTIATTVIRVLF